MASGDNSNKPCNCHQNFQTLRCAPENPCCSIRKLVGLLEDPITADSTDRLIIILDDFLCACRHSFWARDLPYISRVLELIIEQPKRLSNFYKQVESMLLLCASPPMLICSSEVLQCKEHLKEYFNFLGYLLVKLQDDHLRDLVIRALWCLLEVKTSHSTCCVTLEVRQETAEASNLTEIVAQLAEVADEAFYTTLIQFCICLAKISENNCYTLAQNGALGYMMLRMDPWWKTRHPKFPPHVNMYCNVLNYEYSTTLLRLLLNSLKNCPKDVFKKIKPPSLEGLWSFHFVLRVMTWKNGTELNRNDLFSILLQCMNLFPDMPFVQSGLAEDLAILSVATENGVDYTWYVRVRFKNNDTDYHFKKLLLLTLCSAVKHFSVIQIFKKRNVLKGLLKIISPEKDSIWIQEQRCRLIILTFHVLQEIVPHLMDDFTQNNGIVRLLTLVDMYNSKPYDTDMLLSCLKCLHSVANLQHLEIIEDLQNNYAVSIVTGLCNYITIEKPLTLQYQTCLAYCFSILQILHKHVDPSDGSSLRLAITYMKKFLQSKPQESIHDPKVLICCLDLLWQTLNSSANLKQFIEEGCVYMLLDITEKSVFPVQLLSLGILVDLCEEGSCIPYLITWRRNGMRLIPLLMKIFREENKKLGVKRTSDEMIDDIEKPLMGSYQIKKTYFENKNPKLSPAIIDIIGSCRPKIYALLQLLKTRHKERVEIANEHYKLLNEPISVKDQITKLVAENYLTLKLGEAWVEVKKDFEIMGVSPIGFDGQAIQALTHNFRKWSLYIKEAQQELLMRKSEEDTIKELEFYDLLKESKLNTALKALQQLDYLARTIEHMFRLAHKMVQNRQIEQSLMFDHENCHRTFMSTIGVTSVFKQTVNIQTYKDPRSNKIIIDPVSSESSDENVFESPSLKEVEKVKTETYFVT